jgi:hypothetical protein
VKGKCRKVLEIPQDSGMSYQLAGEPVMFETPLSKTVSGGTGDLFP